MRPNWEALWYSDRRGIVFWLLAPLSLLYGIGLALVQWVGTWRRPTRLPVRVISVGNLVVGGAGKTPVVIELCRRALAAGERVAVLSRGYGRSSTALVRVSADALPPVDEAGDEPRLIARHCPGVVVWVCADRVRAAQAAVEAGATVVLLDDGFQHRRLARDVDILVDNGLGNGWLLPAGPLREWASARSLATLTWGRNGQPGDVRSQDVLLGLRAPDGALLPLSELQGREVVALSGIARPERFLASLRAAGAVLRRIHAFPDHYRFSEATVRSILDEARGALVVTTEKDLERLPVPLHALALGLAIHSGEAELLTALGFGYAKRDA